LHPSRLFSWFVKTLFIQNYVLLIFSIDVQNRVILQPTEKLIFIKFLFFSSLPPLSGETRNKVVRAGRQRAEVKHGGAPYIL
jgi:hypothetical protein